VSDNDDKSHFTGTDKSEVENG